MLLVFVVLLFVMLIIKQLRHTRTALFKPNFGKGACEFEHTPQKTPPQLRQWCRRRNVVNDCAQDMHCGASSSGIQRGGGIIIGCDRGTDADKC